MCGIAGFIGKGTEEDLLKMQRAILHRGPDDQGLEFSPGVGLAHTRLSILDLSPLGHQPMFSLRRRIGLVFNGEIYNFQLLRDDLLSTGKYSFKGGSDTEVILALYEEYGTACFSKMDGMFAIALYDYDSRELILARDRIGKKPLYWADFSGTILFGSELKALMAHSLFVKEIDPESFAKYLTHDYVPTPHTIFKNTHKLNPGTFCVWKNGVFQKEIRYWNICEPVSSVSFSDALRELDRRLEHAVATRLVADVPVGVFLSGGIDSSAIAYYAQRGRRDPIKTFSIAFTDPSYDESTYAEIVARHLGTEHHSREVSSKDLLDFIPQLGDVLDEPVADASIVPMYFLAQHAKESVSVALGGDGGDELFAGYPTFVAEKYARFVGIFPELLRKNAACLFHEGDGYLSFGFKIRKFLEGLGADRARRHAQWLGSFNEQDLQVFLKNPLITDLYESEDFWNKEYEGDDYRNQLLYQYLRTYLMDEVMVKVDRATMAHALEARAPFLDTAVVEYAHQIPFSCKLRGLEGKHILKKLLSQKDDSGKPRLPQEIVYRQKKGFGIPLTRWLREDLKSWTDAVLSEESIADSGLLNYDAVARIKHEHFEGKRDNRKLLWNLLVFEVWRKRWME